MYRICRIFVPFSNQQTEAAKDCILKLESLTLTPDDVQVLPTVADQKELCIKLLILCSKTDEEAEVQVRKIWSNHISGALKEFEYDNVQIAI
jgi:hypothetical protein